MLSWESEILLEPVPTLGLEDPHACRIEAPEITARSSWERHCSCSRARGTSSATLTRNWPLYKLWLREILNGLAAGRASQYPEARQVFEEHLFFVQALERRCDMSIASEGLVGQTRPSSANLVKSCAQRAREPFRIGSGPQKEPMPEPSKTAWVGIRRKLTIINLVASGSPTARPG